MANVFALSHNVRVPQVAGHKQREAAVRADDGEQDAHRAQMIDPLLRGRHTRTIVHNGKGTVRLHVACRVVERRTEFGPALNDALVLFATPITPIGPRFVTRTIASFPDIVVIQSVS